MPHFFAIDTLAYANKLKAAGLDPSLAEAQADAQAELLSVLIDNQLATKNDIKDVRNEIKQLENKLVIKLGGMAAASTGLLATLLTLFHLY